MFDRNLLEIIPADLLDTLQQHTDVKSSEVIVT